MPAIRTRDTSAHSLEVAVAGPDTTTNPMLNVISPTPRAFMFPMNAMNAHTPSPSPSNSPFEPDLGSLTFSTPPPASRRTHTPSSSISSIASLSLNTTNTLSTDGPTSPSSHRRRRSTVSDISERRPKKGDEDYIKRPENAFILFRRKCCEDRNLVQGAGDAGEGDGSAPKKQRQADLSKTISQQWKSLSAEERQYWEDLAKEKKKEHEALYPNYVYRPQRVKGKKSANGKGKGRGAEEPESDTEGLSFVMPVPAVPQRVGRRAISVPTPPPAYQQTIHIPMVYMPSTPSSPPTVPIANGRTCSPFPTEVSSGGVAYHYNGALLPAFNNPPQGWTPDGCEDAYATVFDLPQLDPLSIPPCAPPSDALFKSPSPGSYTNSNSSGPSSPYMSPYTPTALETLHVTADAWQAQTSLPMLDVEPPVPVSLEYQPYSWATAPDLWVNGSAPMFTEDFDIAMIPPISISVPKFEGLANVADQSCAHDFLNPQTGEQDGDTYAPVFTFNDANEIQLVDGF